MHLLLAPPERGVEGGEEFDARQGLCGRKGRFGARDVPREDVDPLTAHDHWKARRTARRSRRSATKTSAPRARRDCARSSSPRTIARTGKPICKRSFVATLPVAPAAPPMRIGTEVISAAPATLTFRRSACRAEPAARPG